MWRAIASGVSALGNFFGISSNNRANLKAVREQNRANRELADLAYQRNLDMWNRQNVYNSPKEQVARLKAANLNPNLIYGSGAASAGNASAAPQYDAPHIEAYRQSQSALSAISPSIGDAITRTVQLAQLKNMQASEGEIRQRTANLAVDNQLKSLKAVQFAYQNEMDKYRRDRFKDMYDAQIRSIMSKTSLTDVQRNSTYNEEQRNQLRFPLVLEQIATNIDNSAADVALKRYTHRYLQPLQLAQMKANIANAYASVYLKHAQESFTYANFGLTNSRKFTQDLENATREVLLDFGIDLKGDAVERATYQLMKSSGLSRDGIRNVGAGVNIGRSALGGFLDIFKLFK